VARSQSIREGGGSTQKKSPRAIKSFTRTTGFKRVTRKNNIEEKKKLTPATRLDRGTREVLSRKNFFRRKGEESEEKKGGWLGAGGGGGGGGVGLTKGAVKW